MQFCIRAKVRGWIKQERVIDFSKHFRGMLSTCFAGEIVHKDIFNDQIKTKCGNWQHILSFEALGAMVLLFHFVFVINLLSGEIFKSCFYFYVKPALLWSELGSGIFTRALFSICHLSPPCKLHSSILCRFTTQTHLRGDTLCFSAWTFVV